MNVRLKVTLLIVMVLAISMGGYFGLQDFGRKESLETNRNVELNAKTTVSESAQQPTNKPAVTEPDIGGSNMRYSEEMEAWNKQSEGIAISAIPESEVLSPELTNALNEAISGAEEEAELSKFIQQYSGEDLEHNQKLIALLIDDNQLEQALELATLVWQSNPGVEEAKAQYAKAYKLCNTIILNKQNEIISGGTQ
ncbi:hypothetical protein [Paenibacillus sp. FSL H3-0333]|uniref:hypothetical protein n=1 Tax=Paenibacillus sp. FSL H3-0333 TaxID=2921373 RepID=UPI0030F4E3F1